MTRVERAIAAIDIGSDTIHLLVGVQSAAGPTGTVERIDQRGELIELGRRVARTGRIGTRAARDIEGLLRDYVAVGRKRADRLVVGATEALRRATDGPELVDALATRIGLPVRVLSGEREAELGFAGVANRLADEGSQLVIDSGGASTEVTLCEGRARVGSASLPVGAALLGASLTGDPPEALAWALLGTRIGEGLLNAPTGTPARAIATGGSAHNLAGLERTAGRSGAQELTLVELGQLAAELLSKPVVKLARRSGEDPRRVALLPPGLLIVAAVLAHYRLDRVTVVPEGLREGMILAAASLEDDWWRDSVAVGERGMAARDMG